MRNKEWKKYKLSDITYKLGDGLHGTPKYDNNGEYYFINGNNLENGKIVIKPDTKKVSFTEYQKYKKELNNNTILLSINGTLGNIGYYNNEKVILGKSACYFNLKDGFSKDYVRYIMSTKPFKLFLENFATGATIKNVSLDVMRNFEFYAPCKDLQDKIAKILSNYDNLIENNNKRIKILEEMAQKIYKEWFVDFKFPGHETTTFKDSPLGKIPNDWEVKKVVELSTLSKGKSYKSSELVDKKDGLPFLNLKCVERDGGFKREGLKWFCGKYNDNHVVLPEDIIMAVTDMTQERKLVARPARIPHNWYKKYIMSMDLVKLVANNDINKTYLYSLLKYSNFSDEVKNHANGVNVLHLNPQNIEQFELVVASEPLRNNFGEFAKRIFNQIDVLYLKNENLKQTRDILLPRLISGEINVENMEVL